MKHNPTLDKLRQTPAAPMAGVSRPWLGVQLLTGGRPAPAVTLGAPAIESGFDYSPFEAGELSQNQTDGLAAVGFSRACIALDSAPASVNTCLAVNRSGLTLSGYRELALSYPESIATDVQDVLTAFAMLANQGVYVGRLWLTAEDTTGDTASMEAALQQAVDGLKGFDIGIYSGWWYQLQFPSVLAPFMILPQWWAAYDGVAAIPTGFHGKQYEGNQVVGGVNIDLNVWTV